MKRKYIINTCVILAFFVVILGVFFLVDRFNSAGSSMQQELQTDKNAVLWDGSLADTTPGTSGIKIPGYGNIYFPAGESLAPITLCNPAENSCFFRFELYVDGEAEPAFTSGLIAPGYSLNVIELERIYPVGEHDLIIKINTSDAKTGAEKNGAEVQTKLIVS